MTEMSADEALKVGKDWERWLLESPEAKRLVPSRKARLGLLSGLIRAALPRPPAADAGEVQAPSPIRKAPQWADDSDPIGDLAIKLAARASAIEEEEGRGEWTWREIAQCAVDALAPAELGKGAGE